MWGHPDQEEGPRAFAEKRPAAWQRGPTAEVAPDAGRREVTRWVYEYQYLRLERHGPVGWLINNRPERSTR